MKNKKYILNIALILLIGGLFLYYSIGGEYEAVKSAFKSAKLIWIIVMICVMLLYYMVDGLSLLFFGRAYKKDYTFKQSFVNAISGTFFNGITPFASGGQFAQVYIFNQQGIVPTHSSSILVMCFVSYQSVLVLYSAVILILKYNYFMNVQSQILNLAILAFLINCAVIAILFGASKSSRVQNFLTHKIIKLLAKMKIVKDYEVTATNMERYLEEFRNQINFLQNNRSVFLKSTACNFIKLTIIYSMPFFAIKALNIPVTLKDLPTYIGLCSLIYLINAFLPVPGASGGSEGVFLLLFAFLGPVMLSSAMLLWRLMSYYFGLIVGGFVFMFNYGSKEKKME